MKKLIFASALGLTGVLAGAQSYSHTVQAETLGRGVVAVKADNGVFVSWRQLAGDAPDMTYDVYRDGVKLNDSPIATTTCFHDAQGTAGATYEVKGYVGQTLVDAGSAKAWEDCYMRVHLQRPEGGTSKPGGADAQPDYTYTPDDVSVGDVDGDGEYELIVKWFPTNAADNSFYRYTGNTLIDCYKLDGTFMWRVDLGHNIRSGNHYTQFMVWDFDGDGKAEVMCKTAPGTVDGKGNAVLMGSDKVTDDYRNSQGHVISGPEYLTVFDGMTGAERATVAYNPPRDIRKFDKSSTGWGDSYGGRSERYLACVAYLDGEHPSGVFIRGYYTASYIWAVDFDGTNITERWLHKSETSGKGLYGEGAHSITVGDVDGDGCDEIMFGAAACDHDGSFMYRTGYGHGDALHLAAMLPERDGLQVFMPHESKTVAASSHMRDARTGEVLYYLPQTGSDNGRGIAANICSAPGYEYWSSAQRVPENAGVAIGSKKPSINFRIYWDGDLLDELLDGTTITKPNAGNTSISTIREFSGVSHAASCNSTKKTPNLQADIMGDWREEVIFHDSDTESDLLIFSTTVPTTYKVTCLMQDRQYREAIAWQNVAYNQPPHLSYNLEESRNTAATIVVTEGTANQVVNLGEEMTPVIFKVKRAQGVEKVAGPDWLTVSYDAAAETGTITGTPDAEGEFDYTVATVGGSESDYTLQGKVIVRRGNDLKLMATYSFDSNGLTTVNGIEGVAEATGGEIANTDGKKGNAAKFNGAYYRQGGYPDLDFGNKDFTIEMWMRSTDDAAYILHKGSLANDGDTHTGHWVGIEYKNGALKMGIDDDAAKSDLTVADATKWFDGEWHYLVAVRDTYSKKLIMYVDGEAVGEADDATGAIECAAEDLIVGNVNVNFNNSYIGDIDELSIYRGAMSAAKVSERYQTMGKELAYLPMDELTDVTPNIVYGEAKVVGSGLELTQGLKGGAVKFNNSAYLEQAAYDAVQMGENSFTVEFWTNSTDADGYLFFKGSHSRNDANGTTGHWIGIERKNGYLTFTIDDDVTKTDCKLADADYAFDGKWHHIAGVRDYEAKTMSLYIDGKEVAQVSGVKTGALADNNEPMRIGNSDETNREFDGLIDEFTIHGKALSADEVDQIYGLLKDAAAGITDIISGGSSRYTVVDAMSGIVMRDIVAGDVEAATSGLATGVYVIVEQKDGNVANYKYVKR